LSELVRLRAGLPHSRSSPITANSRHVTRYRRARLVRSGRPKLTRSGARRPRRVACSTQSADAHHRLGAAQRVPMASACRRTACRTSPSAVAEYFVESYPVAEHLLLHPGGTRQGLHHFFRRAGIGKPVKPTMSTNSTATSVVRPASSARRASTASSTILGISRRARLVRWRSMLRDGSEDSLPRDGDRHRHRGDLITAISWTARRTDRVPATSGRPCGNRCPSRAIRAVNSDCGRV